MNRIFAVAGVVIRELYRRKDFYVLFILTALMTLLLGSINFFNDDQIVGYLKEFCLLLIWVSALVITITTAARQIPAERENRTIFPLLAKPIARWQVLVGKFLGCWLAAGIALLVFYVFFGAITAAREKGLPAGSYLQAAWMHWQMLGVIVAMVLCGSVILSTPAANVTFMFVITLGILFIGRYLNSVAAQMSEPSQSIVYALYYSIPHLEFFDLRKRLVHDWSLVEWKFIGASTLYAWAYASTFLLGACAVFRRKALD
jgi:ABC-type transport system involved in multi-copper enzyme maturation permease subunit